LKSKILNNLLVIGALLVNALVYGQSTFNNYYVSGRFSGVNHIITEPNGDYLLTGYYKDSSTLTQGFECRRINSLGTTIKRKRFLIGNDDIGVFFKNKQVLNFNNTKYFYTGGTYTGTLSTVLFAAIDKNTMDTLWCKRFMDGDDRYMAHLFKINSNQIWIVGTKFNSTSPNVFDIIKYDTLGNLVGTKTFTAYTGYECYNIAYDAANAKFYTAGLNFNTNPLTSYNLACIDTSGNVIWNNQIWNNNNLFYNDIQLFNNQIYLCGSLKVSTILGSGEFKLAFAKYQKSNGSLVVSKNYCNAFLGNQFNSMYIKNNSVFLTGAVSTQTNLYNGYRHAGIFFKIKHNGDSTSMKLYNHFTGNLDNLEMFFDIKECNDGGFIMGGVPVYVTAPQSQNWVVKTDSNGVGPGMVTVSIKEFSSTNLKLTIYPIPTNDLLNIEFNTLKEQTYPEGKIILINELGQKLKEQEINISDKKISLDIKDIPKGIYILQVKIGTESFMQKVVKE
jgi:hypothetical protein